MKHSALYVILLVLMTVGCKPKVPSELVQPDDLEDILYEYHLAQSMARNEHTLDASYNQTKYFLAVLLPICFTQLPWAEFSYLES